MRVRFRTPFLFDVSGNGTVWDTRRGIRRLREYRARPPLSPEERAAQDAEFEANLAFLERRIRERKDA